MAQTYYEILGLDAPPTDRKAVKRAYSKQLKQTRPEDDPDGFMRLRDAHDFALNMLRYEAEAEAQAEAEPESEPTFTYADMVEDEAAAPDTPSPTAYAIGPTPSLDAPANVAPREVKDPPLTDAILAIMQNETTMNDRALWNDLFIRARALDIDDYVDFEDVLLYRLLLDHGFFSPNNNLFDTPERMPRLLSPGIAASLHKTMNWDSVGTANRQRQYRIDWLERRMGVRENRPIVVTHEQISEQTGPNAVGWIWPLIILIFIFAQAVGYLESL